MKVCSRFRATIEEEDVSIQEKVSVALKTGVISEEVEVLFLKLREMLGGNIKRIVTGSVTILPETVHFLRAVLNCEIAIGYGLTECAGVTFYTPKGDRSLGHVGSPISAL